MATNVSQQDETLHKVIEWCEQREVEGLRLANALLQKHDLAAYAVVKAQIDAYYKTAEHCRSMLGYSGSMPSDVPNQSEDTEMSRTDTTAMLSQLVEKRLRNQVAFWASEVNFDRNTPEERRVDYVGFEPWNINGEPVPASVEKGCFSFYEVKSCMADFTSGNGLTFYGDSNFLVCTKELCDEIVWRKMVPPRVNAILTPDSTGSKLILDYVQSYNDLSYRRRPASEILWAMVKANGKRTN